MVAIVGTICGQLISNPLSVIKPIAIILARNHYCDFWCKWDFAREFYIVASVRAPYQNWYLTWGQHTWFLFLFLDHWASPRGRQQQNKPNWKFATVLLHSMLPLFLKDGLLLPYVVTSVGFLFFSLYLLSALDHCTVDELRLGFYQKLLFWLPEMDLACVVRWKVRCWIKRKCLTYSK